MKLSGRGAVLWLLIAGTGAMLGILTAASGLLPMERDRAVEIPLPHLVPRNPEGVALRFAMVDDVIHEQFLRHGKAYYEDRNRRMRERLERTDLKEEERFAAMDDLGAGLDLTGKHDEAIALMRQKLAMQGNEGTERDRYTSYANLGTFLIHGSAKAAIAGNESARRQMEEGLRFIHRSIEANPGAHFGREHWQAITAEHLLSALKDPRLLLRYDLAGNRLSDPVAMTGPLAIPARRYAGKKANGVAGYLQHVRSSPETPVHGRVLQMLREPIARVGAEGTWTTDVSTSLQEPAQFDEPVLGIVGMWRLGGGANPHFALALGGIMERVDRPALAWACYARAAELADRFWPDETIQIGLRVHCENRQRYLAGRLGKSHDLLYHEYSERLAEGKRRTQAYEEEEVRRLAAGTFEDDLPFKLELAAQTSMQREDTALDTISIPLGQLSPLNPARLIHLLPAALFGAGAMIFLASFVRDRRPARVAARA
ncbi:MAG: hypothetical protein ACO1QR_12190 [Chthoniobacteraceae bacterium]